MTHVHQGLSALELSELAATDPNMWPMIRNHPNCYPDLAEWIDAQQPPAPDPAPALPNQTLTLPPVTAPMVYRGALAAAQFILLIALTQPIVSANTLLGGLSASYFTEGTGPYGIIFATAYLGIGATAVGLMFIRHNTLQQIAGALIAAVSLLITGWHILQLVGLIAMSVSGDTHLSATPILPILVVLGLVSTGLAVATVLTAKKITTS